MSGPMPTRERCGVCHRVSPVGFDVPDEIWRASLPERLWHTVLCVSCFVSWADERMVRWCRHIRFYPVSRRAHLLRNDWAPIEDHPRDNPIGREKIETVSRCLKEKDRGGGV